jgi:hypothetical protein
MYNKKCLGLTGLLLAVQLFSGLGCSRTPTIPSLADYNTSNIQRLRNAYSLYVAAKGKGPADEKALKDYLKNDPAAEVRLKRMGVPKDTLDDIFLSERDGKPFKIRFGIASDRDEAVIFEAVGINGKRMVGFFTPQELGDEEYQAYWTGKKKGESFDAAGR